MIANNLNGTSVDEIAAGIFRISTPMDVIPGGFTFNSYLVAGRAAALSHRLAEALSINGRCGGESGPA